MIEFTFGMIAGLLLFPWWALALFAVMIAAEVCFCHHEEHTWGVLILLISTGLFMQLGAGVNPFTYAWDNLGTLLLFSLYYFAIGGAWSILKWVLYSLKLKRQLLEDRERHRGWAAANASSTLEPPCRPEESYAKNSKSRLAGWVALWPFSMLCTLLGDFLTEIVDRIVDVLSNVYNAISSQVWGDIE